MNSEPATHDRKAAFRDILVRMPTTTVRPRARTLAIGIVGAVVAFAAAGAITGGAVAGASGPSQTQLETDGANQGAGAAFAVEEDAQLLGQPFFASGTGTVTIKLGTRPVGANAIVEAVACLTPGKFEESVDGADAGGTKCKHGGIGSIGQSTAPITTDGAHTFSFTTSPGGQYSVWISWIKMPTLDPSPADKVAIADGTVTRDEYLAAFNQYLGCMSAAGYPIIGYGESGPLVQYSLDDNQVSSGADHRCYATQFLAVDELWQTEDGEIHQK